ncbi:hypothetical protein [Chryseobacterium nematophagum]|uniref:hypothetical protein n=1 Tax=Chryseobacterium nematophagum TaxID=2305228 RepID=UPI0011C37CFA|nr:hypothetical protein [Chryseobacterium nematophagum]
MSFSRRSLVFYKKYIYNYTDHLGNVRLSYFNNGGQLMKYDISSSGAYQLKYTGKLDIYKGINQGSNQISTEYKFMGKDVVNAVNKLGKPHP